MYTTGSEPYYDSADWPLSGKSEMKPVAYIASNSIYIVSLISCCDLLNISYILTGWWMLDEAMYISLDDWIAKLYGSEAHLEIDLLYLFLAKWIQNKGLEWKCDEMKFHEFWREISTGRMDRWREAWIDISQRGTAIV